MLEQPYLLHALSPLHAGTGQGVDAIDLPIARMRSTGIPILPGSSVKGVLREARSHTLPSLDLLAVFGPEMLDASKHAGALVVGDARLLALPVRSFKGTFAWVTSPLLLELARRDCRERTDLPASLADTDQPVALVGQQAGAQSCLNLQRTSQGAIRVYLEDLDLPVREEAVVADWAQLLAPVVSPTRPELFQRRLVVVNDETMTFLWETATQVDTRVRLSSATRTVEEGALWIEESLPPETLLLGLLAADRSRSQLRLNPPAVMQRALAREEILQFGGKATVGRGRCRMIPFVPQAAALAGQPEAGPEQAAG